MSEEPPSQLPPVDLASQETSVRINTEPPIRGNELFDASTLRAARRLVDNTMLKSDNEVLAYRATHDSVTGFYNRAGFENRIDELRSENPELVVGILFVDLDRFKAINDTLNHAYGDRILKYTAEWLQKTVRHENARKGDVISRDGGDEFVVGVLLDPNARDEEGNPISPAKQLIKIHQRMLETYAIESAEDNPRIADMQLGMSVGAVIWEEDMTLSEAKEAADRLMYMEKDRKDERTKRAS